MLRSPPGKELVLGRTLHVPATFVMNRSARVLTCRKGEMTKTSFRVLYDSATHTLYVTTDGNVPSVVRDGDPGKLSHYRIDGDDLVGVTIAAFDAYWDDRFDALPREAVPRARCMRSAAAR